MDHRSGHELRKWGDLPQTPFSHNLMEPCSVLPGSLSIHKNEGPNAMAVCVWYMPLALVIAVPVHCVNRVWDTARKPRSHVG